MATKVFISFRFSDGKELKEELIELFDSSTEVINRSEDVDRSEMSEDTIQEYLYEKLKKHFCYDSSLNSRSCRL